MARSKPFSRSLAMIAMIRNITLAYAGNPFVMQEKLSSIGPYISRGKGRSAKNKTRHGAHMDRVRMARKAHNKAIRGQ